MARNVIDKLLALEDELHDYIADETDDRIIMPLLNVEGALSHLKDGLKVKRHFEEASA